MRKRNLKLFYFLFLIFITEATAQSPGLKPRVLGESTCDFAYSQLLCNPLSINFQPGDTIDSFWDFGDGTLIKTNLLVSHTYSKEGIYKVKFFSSKCEDTLYKSISIKTDPGDVIVTNDTIICEGTGIRLRAANAIEYCWSSQTNQVQGLEQEFAVYPEASTTYSLKAKTIGQNLISNGGFEEGNIGFSSGYNYASKNTTEGEFFVGTNPQAWNSALSVCSDRSGSSGNMLLVNGSPQADVIVWKQTITVNPNTNYEFAAWLQALWPPNPAKLQFAINGIPIGSIIEAQLPTCTWARYFTNWSSGTSSSAEISIVNKNTEIQGNDFALDDISFSPVYISDENVNITVKRARIYASNDTTVCFGDTVELRVAGSLSYKWSPEDNLINSSGDKVRSIVQGERNFYVVGEDEVGCKAYDTVKISTMPLPLLSIQQKEIELCIDKSVELNASGGILYEWKPVVSLSNPSVPNPVASPKNNIRYTVQITGANGCKSSDSLFISVRDKPDFVISPVDTSVCKGYPIRLAATGGHLYRWNQSIDIADVNLSEQIIYPDISSQYIVQVIDTLCKESATLKSSLLVNDLPSIKITKSNDINCDLLSAQLNATGAVNYTWQPVQFVSNNQASNPIVNPISTTTFVVQGVSEKGCIGKDSIIVNVAREGEGKIYQMPSAFTPNNDGLNDCFGTSKWGSVNIVAFKVYDRWGKCVFDGNHNNCWNGKLNGMPMPGGAYAYFIRAETLCGAVERKGLVILIR